MSLRFTPLAAAAICLLCGPVLADETVPNPRYQRWASFKAGSSVTFHAISEQGGVKNEALATTTMKSINDREIEVEIAKTMFVGKEKFDGPTFPQTIPAMVDKKTHDEIESEITDRGKQTLTIEGEKYECTFTVSKREQQGVTFHEKTWYCDRVPGHMVKWEQSTTGAVKTSQVAIMKKFTVAE